MKSLAKMLIYTGIYIGWILVGLMITSMLDGIAAALMFLGTYLGLGVIVTLIGIREFSRMGGPVDATLKNEMRESRRARGWE